MRQKTILLLTAIIFASLPAGPKIFAAEDILPADDVQNKTLTVTVEDLPGGESVAASAEDAISQWTASQALSIDESADLKELGVGQPTLLPDSPFYFLKNWNRNIQSFFTFDQTKKAELQLKFSSEKIAEAKELLNQKKEQKALETMQQSGLNFEKAKDILSRQQNGPGTDQALEKMAQKAISHQKILDGLQKGLALDKQTEVEIQKENLAKNYLSVEDPQKVQERIQTVLANSQGSDLKEIKNLQILKNFKDAAPENIKEKISAINEGQIKNLNAKMSSLAPEKAKAIQSYLNQIAGSEAQTLSVISDLKDQNLSSAILDNVDQAQEKLVQRLNGKLDQAQEQNLTQSSQKILEKLNNGDMDKMEILKKMEQTASSGVLPQVLEAENQSRDKLIQKMQSMTEDQRQQFIKDLAANSNITTLQILNENLDALTPEKKQQLEQASKEVQKMLKGYLSQSTTTAEELQSKLNKVFDGSVEDLQLLQEITKGSPYAAQIDKEAIKSIEGNIDLQDPAAIEAIKKLLENGGLGSNAAQLLQKINSAQQNLESQQVQGQTELKMEDVEKMLDQIKKVEPQKPAATQPIPVPTTGTAAGISGGGAAGLANPASTYCVKLGYKLDIRTGAEGQTGYCVFGGGNECEEWKFYRGECGKEYKEKANTPTNSTMGR